MGSIATFRLISSLSHLFEGTIVDISPERGRWIRPQEDKTSRSFPQNKSQGDLIFTESPEGGHYGFLLQTSSPKVWPVHQT